MSVWYLNCWSKLCKKALLSTYIHTQNALVKLMDENITMNVCRESKLNNILLICSRRSFKTFKRERNGQVFSSFNLFLVSAIRSNKQQKIVSAQCRGLWSEN